MAREYAKLSPRFWTGETGRKIRGNRDAQVLATYLISAPGSTMTGIYYLPLPIVGHEIGMTASEVADALALLVSIEFARYDHDLELVWIPAMAAWQIDDQLKPGDKRVIGVKKELALLNGHPFVVEFWARYGRVFCLGTLVVQSPIEGPMQAPSKALRSQEQEQEQEQEQSPHSGSDSVPLSASDPDPERAIPGATASFDVPRGTIAPPSTPMTPSQLMRLWGKARLAAFGGHPFDENGHGIKPESARAGSDLVNATVGAAQYVEKSMLRFWGAVKSGEIPEAREFARKPAFAFGSWLVLFPGDFEELSGVMPEIPKRDRAGPVGRQPSTATREAAARFLARTGNLPGDSS